MRVRNCCKKTKKKKAGCFIEFVSEARMNETSILSQRMLSFSSGTRVSHDTGQKTVKHPEGMVSFYQ